MPRPNRVDPWGDVYAVASKAAMFTGNRGCIVDERGEIARHHRGSLWITCLLEFKGWRHELAEPGRWTPIFFLDDAVALAAGHRPCGLCRRADYRSYRSAASTARAAPEPLRATELNRALALERLRRGGGVHRARDRKTWMARLDDLPDGTVVVDDGPRLVLGDHLLAFSFDGWYSSRPRASRFVEVITPPTSVGALGNGFRPMLHASATCSAGPPP